MAMTLLGDAVVRRSTIVACAQRLLCNCPPRLELYRKSCLMHPCRVRQFFSFENDPGQIRRTRIGLSHGVLLYHHNVLRFVRDDMNTTFRPTCVMKGGNTTSH